jgi:hypothetical protein
MSVTSNSETFIVQYYDYYGHLITTTLSEPTISTTIPSITYAATYSQVATLLSPSLSTSIESSGTFIVTVTLSTLVDTASTTEVEIVVLPTSPQVQSNAHPSQTSQAATNTSGGTVKPTTIVGLATITSGANPSQSPIASSAQNTPRKLHGGAIAGIAIGAALTILFLFALGWCLVRRHRRRTEPQSATLNRAESKGFKKAELEGTAGSRTFEWQSKPELPGSEEIMADGAVDISSRTPESTGHAERTITRRELEAVPTPNPSNRVRRISSLSTGIPQSQQVEGPAPSPPTTSLECAAPMEEVGLLKGHPNETSSPKYIVVTESSPQAQAVMDASQLDKLKAQERELAEYIEAHETLQKLKNEHIALQERIRVAEERARRSKTRNPG